MQAEHGISEKKRLAGRRKLPALVKTIVETMCHLIALLSVAIRKSCLGVLSAHGYRFQKQSHE
jgi:hypothetical protein